MKKNLVILGGGLSGIAAAIRCARYFSDITILEQHSHAGGLNSYFYRNGHLLETGLHAITNFAEPGNRKAPLNKLFKQLELERSEILFCEQRESEILFHNQQSLVFSNSLDQFKQSIAQAFPQAIDTFCQLIDFVQEYNPFTIQPFVSARHFLQEALKNPLLVDMLLCPLMYYGSSIENDMDLPQFVIMFRAIFLEGMFRPRGTIKDFLDFLLNHFAKLGGTIRYRAKAVKIHCHKNTAECIELENGELLECRYIVSTIGHEETLALLGGQAGPSATNRLGFIESIFYLAAPSLPVSAQNKTIIFFNTRDHFKYAKPDSLVDLTSGVICFPAHFKNYSSPNPSIEIRTTHLANYQLWKELHAHADDYARKKQHIAHQSWMQMTQLIGNFTGNIVYENTFTPLTIERFTAKKMGAIYGSPEKIKDGFLGFTNLFLAGTDQGFLGIIGSMMSGVSIVNQHILPKL